MISRKFFAVLAAMCVVNAFFVSATSEKDVEETKKALRVVGVAKDKLGVASSGMLKGAAATAAVSGVAFVAAIAAHAAMSTDNTFTKVDIKHHPVEYIVRNVGKVVCAWGLLITTGLLLAGLTTKGLSVIAKKVEENGAEELDEKLAILNSMTPDESPVVETQ
eukprot:GHVT01031904.1.p1 GENE.GHVT01031904.1~~GHVT01031904.1.p1  ORF type:complete len:163 (+),score=34.18 GHVT01031904.1:106-594(+)